MFLSGSSWSPSSGWQTAKRCLKMWKKQSSCSTCAVKWVCRDHVQGCVSMWACDSPEHRPSDTRRYYKPSVLKKTTTKQQWQLIRQSYRTNESYADCYLGWTFWTRSAFPRFEKVMVSKLQICQHYSAISAICSWDSARIEDRVQCKATPQVYYMFWIFCLLFVNKLCSMEKKVLNQTFQNN